ncbi:MAG: PKD domain-containing protein [Owenweeksia sp.]
MKKSAVLIIFCLLLGIDAQAQNVQIVIDVWKDAIIGTPQTKQPVIISVNPANGPSSTNFKFTNNQGVIDTIIPHPGIGGYFSVSTVGCDGNYHYAGDTLTTTSSVLFKDTLILNCPSPVCSAGFSHSIDAVNPSKVNFTNMGNTPSSPFSHTIYQISFGDGSSTANNPNASHIYSNSATYQVCMTVTTIDSLYNTIICQDTYCDSVTVTAGPPITYCSQDFNINILDSVNRIVQFNDQSTVTNMPSGGSAEVTWYFQNSDSANASIGGSVNYTFFQPGFQAVGHLLVVYDANQNVVCTSYGIDSLMLPGTPASCNAGFSSTNSTTVPNQVTINIPPNAVSNIPAGGSATYEISLGDGAVVNFVTSYTHTYANSSSYNVCVTVKALDSLGNEWCSDVYCGIVVPNALSSCFASYYLDSLNSGAGTVYLYNNSSTSIPGGALTSYLWDFGDGSSSTQAFPTHNYASYGNYNLCLTVTGSNGTINCMDTLCRTMYVDSSGNAHFKNGGTGFTLVVQDPSIGLQENSAHTLKVYPNPASDMLTVEGNRGGNITWQLIDLRGTRIGEGTEQLNGQEPFTINVSGFPEGLYILSVKDELATEHIKIKLDR